MNIRNLKLRFVSFTLCALMSGALFQLNARAQGTTAQQSSPITSDELVRMVRQLPTRPALRDQIIGEIRRRGIGFPLTNGILSVVATKSGNDALLRRTLEEAERRRLNPVAAALPSEAEGRDVLEKARAATLAAAGAMPDFVVRQLIVRSYARGTTKNWSVADRLTVAVAFRASQGEQYKLLATNGMPAATPPEWSNGLDSAGGATSTGEYVSRLAAIFTEESKTEFKMVDTDTLRGRRAIIYEYEIKRENSRGLLTFGKGEVDERSTTVGDRGRVWVDRETFRVLRLESFSTEIPSDFPITAANRAIDYEWVTIAGQKYLLPSRAVVESTARLPTETIQARNDVRFRDYQKYGTEIRIIDEDVFEEEEPKPEQKTKP